MQYIATFDAGTTAIKGVLVSADGQIAASQSINIETVFEGDHKEQNPREWYAAFTEISRGFAGAVAPQDILGIVMSGQMQDLIPVDAACQPVCNAILYSDGRAAPQAQAVESRLGAAYLTQCTGNHYDGSLPLPKLVWLRENRPDLFARIHKVLISSKDYLIAQLTGVCCGDVTACSTAGAMDIHKKCWDAKILAEMGLDAAIFPQLYYTDEQVGTVTAQAAEACGYCAGTPVYAGVGDAGATTLASGIAAPGQYNINLGTSGWVATVSNDVLQVADGVFNLAAMPREQYINVVPFLNAGNVHKWVSTLFTAQEKRDRGEIDYDSATKALESSTPGSHGVMFLPYLVGERFPVMDTQASGAFIGLTPETVPADMLRACLEGVAFSVRQGIELIGHKAEKVSVIGGGAREAVWCQILADVLGQDVYVYKNAALLPALAIASAVLLANGLIDSYGDFTGSLQQKDRSTVYHPRGEISRQYDLQYGKYRKLYPALKELYA